MSVINYLKEIYQISITKPEPPEKNEDPWAPYPVYGTEVDLDIIWECEECEAEMRSGEGRGMVCPACSANYELNSKDETPKALRTRCPKCNEVSDEIGGFRASNLVFDCPNCEFRWESYPY